MANKQLQQRLETSLRRSYIKRWYQRPWGKGILLIGLVILLVVSYILFMTLRYMNDINSPDLQKTLDNLRQDKTYSKLISVDDPTTGASDPKVIIVAFEDFQCPFSRQADPILKQIMTKYKDQVMLIFRDFPLSSIHPEAEGAAEAANCALQQGKFWEYHDQLFARQDELSPTTYRTIAETLGLDTLAFNKCLNLESYKAEIQADVQDGTDLGVVGTPTFFINGQMFPGVLTFDFMDKILTGLTKEDNATPR